MGQYWLVACPSKRDYTAKVFGRKLSEMLFSSWPDILSDLIKEDWARAPLICIGDCLNPKDLPDAMQEHNHPLTSAKLNTMSSDLRFDIVEREFGFWSYMEEKKDQAETATHSRNRVLRNLTTQEYVLETNLKSGITIGHLVLMRICWSSDSSTSIQGGAYLARGGLAGHKFDIVDAGMLENLNARQWQDVSRDVWDEVEFLWSNNFGEGWETEWKG
ncbi:uncharacterized protein N7458_005208 [Penicillium daleae]|uniref:Uncharacterized protein n=1 Tax=Penicillium daleae TaxID=63821 RepID=A0AAD6CA95_9EURO|nr:uncharacterized protein N7458_005208 [Penicillium daleae]KAJ5454252.1 hypothetical protein N7458_005208 [Penicillium daleae]